MSLINDALKKAQKRHAQGSAAPLPPPVPGGAPAGQPAGGGSPLPSQFLVLCALGAAVLIALSVLATVYLLRRPAAAGPVAAQPVPAPTPVEKPAPSAVTKVPSPVPAIAAPAAPAIASAPLPPPVKSPPPPTPVVVSIAPPAPAPPPIQPAVVSVAPPLDPTKPDPKILAYVDALQVAGVRITSSGGKVLMNDRVYRQNDVVDRLLGLRLKKIGDDTLTFVDERGVTYTKNF